MEALSQDSQTSLNEGSDVTADLQELMTSADEPASDYKIWAER